MMWLRHRASLRTQRKGNVSLEAGTEALMKRKQTEKT
jgi:hypothetical protein